VTSAAAIHEEMTLTLGFHDGEAAVTSGGRRRTAKRPRKNPNSRAAVRSVTSIRHGASLTARSRGKAAARTARRALRTLLRMRKIWA